MKKILAFLLALVMILALFVGCVSTTEPTAGTDNPPATNPKPSEETKSGDDPTEPTAIDLKICMIVTGGTLGDQAANDGMYDGIKMYADESNVQFDAVELTEVADIDMTVRTMAADGYNLFAFNSADGADYMDTLCPDLPDVIFVMYNGTNEGGYDNLINITTDVAGAAFLCGIFGTLMNEQVSGELKCGYIGGIRNPNLERARYAMQAAAELLGGELNSAYVGSFTDAAAAKEIAQQMQSEGVRIIQAWGGGANKGVFEAAEVAGEGYYSLGAATGQYHMSDTIIASLKTKAEELMYDICKQIAAGTLKNGIYEASVANGMIDCVYAPDERADVIPDEITATVEEYRQKLISGEIFAPTTEEEYNEFVATFIK